MIARGKNHCVSGKMLGAKRKRKTLRLEQKIDVISRFERNERAYGIVRDTGIYTEGNFVILQK
jgi:hypothetical protein